MSDALWSDPQPFTGRGPSKRGVGACRSSRRGVLFLLRVVREFCAAIRGCLLLLPLPLMSLNLRPMIFSCSRHVVWP